MEESSIVVDDRRFPIVTVTFRGDATDAQFRAYLDQMTRMVDRREKNAVIMDAREAVRTPPIQRRMQSEWMKTHHDSLARWSVGTAFVITSPLVRGVLTAILWLSPMATPYTVVGTVEEAESWAREQLRRAGATPPR